PLPTPLRNAHRRTPILSNPLWQSRITHRSTRRQQKEQERRRVARGKPSRLSSPWRCRRGGSGRTKQRRGALPMSEHFRRPEWRLLAGKVQAKAWREVGGQDDGGLVVVGVDLDGQERGGRFLSD